MGYDVFFQPQSSVNSFEKKILNQITDAHSKFDLNRPSKHQDFSKFHFSAVLMHLSD